MSRVYYTFFMKNIKKRTILAQNLIKLRKKYGLTQEDLAKVAGISRRVIALYETKPVNPPLHNIEKLANAISASTS